MATLAVYVSVDTAERAQEIIEHGTIMPFLQVHSHDLSIKVLDDDGDSLYVEGELVSE